MQCVAVVEVEGDNERVVTARLIARLTAVSNVHSSTDRHCACIHVLIFHTRTAAFYSHVNITLAQGLPQRGDGDKLSSSWARGGSLPPP